MTVQLAKPSIRRAMWSVIAVAVVAVVVTGLALAAGFISGYSGDAVPAGEYVRLIVSSLTIWGPMYLVIAWQVSVPAIVALGILVACVRVGRPASDSRVS